MRIRFRTRLAVTISLLIAIAVTGMSVVVVSLYASRTGALYYHAGVQLNQLAERNIEYGLSLPHRVLDRVGDQMAVQALLIAELAALAERGGGDSPTLAEMLDRTRDRSSAVHDAPLLGEVWITDEKGEAVVRPEGAPPFNFVEAAAANPQPGPFLKLLERVGAPPVKQEVRGRALDDRPFMYVGAGGVDKPRIVQVGADEHLINGVLEGFGVQKTVDRFMVGMSFERIVVLDPDGGVLAASGSPQFLGEGVADEKVRQFCMDFLDSGESYRTALFGMDVGVVTPLKLPDSERPMALFIQHQTGLSLLMIQQHMLSIFLVGLGAIMMGVVAAVLLSRGLSSPLEALSRGAKALGEGNLDHRIILTRNDEFKGLAQSFNHMAASLRRQVAEIRRQTADRERLESDLRIAADIQKMLLPVTPPDVPGFSMAGLCRPAKTVGGDFFDFIPAEEGGWVAVLGDATGKGMPAALLTTQCWSMMRTLANEFQNPAELLRRTNRELNRRLGPTCRFVTLFCMSVQPGGGGIRYAVAGHNPPLFAPPGGAEARRVPCRPAFPLGLQKGTEYHEAALDLEPGASLLVYSDGATDARNADGASFGEDRLARLVVETATLPADQALRVILDAVQGFCGEVEPFDDITLVLLRRDGDGGAARDGGTEP